MVITWHSCMRGKAKRGLDKSYIHNMYIQTLALLRATGELFEITTVSLVNNNIISTAHTMYNTVYTL